MEVKVFKEVTTGSSSSADNVVVRVQRTACSLPVKPFTTFFKPFTSHFHHLPPSLSTTRHHLTLPSPWTTTTTTTCPRKVGPAKDMFAPTEAEQGELCYRGRNVMMGYLANPDLGNKS